MFSRCCGLAGERPEKMACLNTFDLIPYAESRYATEFTAANGAELRDHLQHALALSGWQVEDAPIDFGSFQGTGFKCTSKASPWCAGGSPPPEYVGKCRVWFRPRQRSGQSVANTEFYVMNESESMLQAGVNDFTPAPTNAITLIPTTGLYAPYRYLFLGTPYDFKVFMLGVNKRTLAAVSNSFTSVLCGVPQIPGFLQARGADWCQIGVDEMFYCLNADTMRQKALLRYFDFYCGGIKSAQGTFVNTNAFDISTALYAWRIAYGVEGGQPFFTGFNQQTGIWARDNDFPITPIEWDALLWPSIIVWATDPANVGTSSKMKGFMWDTVTLNRALPGDAQVRFDSKTFVVFNNNWAGLGSPWRPPGALLMLRG